MSRRDRAFGAMPRYCVTWVTLDTWMLEYGDRLYAITLAKMMEPTKAQLTASENVALLEDFEESRTRI